MNFRKLGNTELKVSTICLGTMTWGEQNSQEDAFKQMDYALDKNVNFWDTAEIYSVPPRKETFGSTEKIIGEWFLKSKKRNKVILASKISGPGLSWIRGGENQFDKKNINLAVEGSLKRLNTDYIDLYQLHRPERSTNYFGKLGYEHEDKKDWNDFETILDSLNDLIKSGKIRYIGLSNETAWGLSKFLEISSSKNLPRIVSVQNPYNLLNRTYEVGIAEISIREKSGLLAYSPLASGILTGKYRNGALPDGSRMKLFSDRFPRYKTANATNAVEEYYKIAKNFDINLAQMCLKFCEMQKFMTSVIIGATTMEQLKTDVESVNVKLNNEVLKKINDIHKLIPNPCP